MWEGTWEVEEEEIIIRIYYIKKKKHTKENQKNVFLVLLVENFPLVPKR